MISNRKSVLVLGHPSDEHAQHVYLELKKRAIHCKIIDVGDFPKYFRIAMQPNTGSIRIGDARSRAVFDPENVSAIYWRNYNHIPRLSLSDQDQAFIAHNDSRSLVESFLGEENFRWVNGLKGYELHQRKPLALSMVAKLGVDIPQTLITNSPEEVRSFCKPDGRYIFKPVQGGAHTQRLKPDQLSDDHLALLRLAPVTIQEEIQGTNIRVFVAGKSVVACEVRTDEIDFRDDHRPDIVEHKIPDWLRQRSLEIAKLLHLSWTGIDYRLTSSGKYYYLEANPSPMFMGFERASGVGLTEILIDHLRGEG